MFADFNKQFEVPKGLQGKIAGGIMSLENKEINRWTLKRLTIQPNDRLLEVGFGPGFAIEQAFKACPSVSIDGVDKSGVMKDAAASRNHRQIHQGKLRLYEKDITAFKSDTRYDKIYTVNNYPLWADRRKGLLTLYALLEEGGKLAITVQPREKDADSDQTKRLGETIRAELENAGFCGAAVHYKNVRPVLAVCVTAVK
ncbi:class I SAM-dependent methyltransferase [Bacillus xiapuensis]|uniref:class I SAM-dependent methyltransferase n=1 Tax=Bacillus xiapuensis TaxID=2014075 RepID=UPI000C2304B0|nr:methyltransferase domain-containing protein [Bacillus xiapuensis]